MTNGSAKYSAGATEVDSDVKGVEKGGCECPDIREKLCGDG